MPVIYWINQKFKDCNSIKIPGGLEFHAIRYSTFEGYGLFILWGVRDFQAFIPSPALIFWSKKVIWLGRNKNKGYLANQNNLLLQNINAGDEMKAWKPLTPHNIRKSYPSKVLYLICSMKFQAACRYLNASPYTYSCISACIIGFILWQA